MSSLDKLLNNRNTSPTLSNKSVSTELHSQFSGNFEDYFNELCLSPPPPSPPGEPTYAQLQSYYFSSPMGLGYDGSQAHYNLPALPAPASSESPPPVHLAYKDIPRKDILHPMATSKTNHCGHTGFKGDDLVGLMGAVVNKNSFMVTYGQKAKIWEETIKLVHERGFCLSHKEPTLRKKIEAILNAHEACTSLGVL
jgi:hypothetical protein